MEKNPLPDPPFIPTRKNTAEFDERADGFLDPVSMRALRELLMRAGLAGFAASREGFNGECAFEHLDRDDKDVLESLAKEVEADDFVRVAVERALKLAGVI